MGKCSVFFAKYAVFSVNLLSSLIGLIFISLGLVVFFVLGQYEHFTVADLLSPSVILVSIGLIVLLIALFGLCGAIAQNTCMMFTFSHFLALLLILQIGVGVYASFNQDKVDEISDKVFNETMKNYGKAWDFVQIQFECCGVNGPDDWKNVDNGLEELPHSCCKNTGSTCKPEDAITLGCKKALFDFMKPYYFILAAIVIFIFVVQVLLVGWSCFLYGSFSKGKNYSTIESTSTFEVDDRDIY